jgi:hypothetical protein
VRNSRSVCGSASGSVKSGEAEATAMTISCPNGGPAMLYLSPCGGAPSTSRVPGAWRAANGPSGCRRLKGLTLWPWPDGEVALATARAQELEKAAAVLCGADMTGEYGPSTRISEPDRGAL